MSAFNFLQTSYRVARLKSFTIPAQLRVAILSCVAIVKVKVISTRNTKHI